jgi:cytochrome P450 PksS
VEATEITTDPQCPMKLFSRRFMKDPYPTLATMRETAAAVPIEHSGVRLWILTRYDDIRRLLNGRDVCKDMVPRRRELFEMNIINSSKTSRIVVPSRRSMLDRDGEDHRRLRRVLAPFFNAEAVAKLQPMVEKHTTAMIDMLPVGEPVDLLGGFARRVSARVIAELVGIPDDYVDEFPAWESRLVTGEGTAEIEAAGMWFYEFGLKMVDLKRREPAEDMYTMLLRAQEADPEVMDDDELVSTFIVLAIAGSEPSSAISNCLSVLLRHPDQLDLLRQNPALLDGAIEECLRLESPFRMLPPRFTDETVELDGVVIPPLSMLVGAVGAANRDPRQFPDPERFDITRRPNRHLSFSHGPHNCLGVGLGKLEVSVALRTLIERFPNMRLAVAPDELTWRPGLYIRRLNELPVILD